MKFIWFTLVCSFISVSTNGQRFGKVASIQFKLPNNSGFVYDGAQVFQSNGIDVVALLYRETRTICYYKLTSGELIECTYFSAEGPDGIGYEIAGFWVENLDEIYIYSYWEFTLFLANSQGKVFKKWKLPVDDKNFPIIELSTSTPMLKLGDKIVIGGFVLSQDGYPVQKPIIFLNTETGSVTNFGTTPLTMQKKYFGLGSVVHYDYARDKGYFIIDFGASDSVFLMRNNFYFSQPAKSNYINEIPPLCEIPCQRKIAKESWLKQNASGSYLGVRYDPFNQCYYRFAAWPKDIDSIHRGELMRTQSILVLDLNLKILQEVDLPFGSISGLAFVTNIGLLVPNVTRYQNENDNYLYFDVYNFSK